MQQALPDSDFTHLIPFNHVYLTLTKKVNDDIEHDRLRNRAAAAQAIPDFCQRYVNPVYGYMLGDYAAMTRQWRRTLDPRVMGRAEPVTQFAGGMIAHIRDDLKRTVEALHAPADYHDDFTGPVGDHIRDTAFELSAAYLPVTALMRRRIVSHVVSNIAAWREEAWDDGVRLMSVNDNPAEYARVEQFEVGNGDRTGRVYRYLGNPALRALQLVAPADLVPVEPFEFERAA